MSESVESPAAESPARKPRGPRAEFTVGDLRTAQRFGCLEALVEKHKGEASFDAALRALASKGSAEAADLSGSGEGERICDKRCGTFVSAKQLGAVAGSKVKIERVGDTMVLSLA